jgi:predicted P-loop ATPase/GTPase
MRKVALTTEDNPFDPIDDFDRWYAFDTQNGYNTASYLARISNYTDFMTDEEKLEEDERAIDEILSYNLTGNYKKVVHES